MQTTLKQVLSELASVGLNDRDLDIKDWIDDIVAYRNTGKCGSVMYSTVEFIPVLSKILQTFKAPDAKD